MGFDIGTLGKARMDAILKAQKEAELDAYLALRLTSNPPEPVKARSGKMRKKPQSYGRGGDEESDRTEVAPGQETPKGDMHLDEFQYRCQYRKMAYGIDHLTGMELEKALPLWAELAKDAAHDVLSSLERMFVDILQGRGTNDKGSDRAVLTETLLTSEQFSNKDADVLRVIRRLVREVKPNRVILGHDVALELSEHPQIIGAAGGSKTDNTKIGFDALGNFFRRHYGITEFHVGVQEFQDGAKNWPFKRGYIHDGTFYMDQSDNLVKVVWLPLQYDEFKDDDREMKYSRAKVDCDICVRFEENSIAVTNPIDNG